MLVLQDHFSKYVVAYVVKDQTARTAAVTLRNGYFGLFGAPTYLVSDQGKAFTGHLLHTSVSCMVCTSSEPSPYHAQTNGQVERMNQTIIRMIGKLGEDKKARWSEHLLELLSAYNGTRSAVTGYSPYYLLLGERIGCQWTVSPHSVSRLTAPNGGVGSDHAKTIGKKPLKWQAPRL